MSETEQDLAVRLQAFVRAREGADAPEITGLTRLSVGRSRENWGFEAAAPAGEGLPPEPLILRRDPEGGLVDTDRAVEFAVLRALEASSLPSPRVRWLDAAGEWMGRPSLVMHRESGLCEYNVLNGNRALGRRLRLAEQFCDLLAQVHQVDWKALGIGEFLDDPGPAAATFELDRWVGVLRHDQLEAYPELDLSIDWLRRTAPAAQTTVLVHGDFKPGNVLLDGDRVVALLDWELAHLGDPMDDIGWITQPLRTREHLIAGAWERTQLLERYQRTTGYNIDEASIRWWNAFSSFKTAVMQVSGLRSFLEGRSDEPYRPTAKVLRTLLDAMQGWVS